MVSFNPRKLEIILKEVNRELEEAGILKERLTYDIWTKLMSNLLQGEYMLAFPIRKELHAHVRKKRQDRIFTFNKIIQRLDEILDRYIPPPVLDVRDGTDDQDRKSKKGKQKQKEPKAADYKSSIVKASRPILRDVYSPVSAVQKYEASVQTVRRIHSETTSQVRHDTFQVTPTVRRPATTKDISIETEKEVRFEEDELSKERYMAMQTNENVLIKTVEDQQLKIKKLETSVTHLEKRNMELLEEMRSLGTKKDDKIDVFRKAETEMKFLRNELQIKEKSLQLSLIERNELLDRLSSVTSTKLSNGNSSLAELSDINRPTQLADKYYQLFESEWTDAFNLLTLGMIEKRTTCQWLLEIIQDCYSFCARTNESHVKLIIENLLYPFKRTSEIKEVDPYYIDEMTRTLIDKLKKAAAKESVAQIQVQFMKHMQRSQKPYYDDKHEKKLVCYVDKCVELCWLMVNQDPALCLDETPISPGDDFDRDAYRFYSQSGSKFDYLVWPALYLSSQDGFLLMQGVAQPKPEGVALRIASSNSVRVPSVQFDH